MRKRIPDWLTLGRFATVAILGFLVYIVVQTRLAAPPEFDLLAGPENSTFYRDALRFQEILARDGVRLNIIETRGSVDNVRRLLEAEGPTAAFVDAVGAIQLQEADTAGGSSADPEPDADPLDGITSLGAIYLQPLWFFVRADRESIDLENVRARRFGVGPEGSTSRLIADLLLRNLAEDAAFELVDVGGADEEIEFEEIANALREDRVQVALVVGQPQTELVDRLLRAPGIHAAQVRRSDAYALHFRYLAPIRLPEGGHDLGDNVPAEDVRTLAASTELLVTGLFPPPLADLLLQATAEVHGGASLFTERNAFPNPDMVSARLNGSAARYYESGPPLLRTVLPFQLATWIDRFIGVVVAFGSIAFALFSIIPKLIEMHLGRKLQAAYRRMEHVEKQFAAGGAPAPLLAELDAIEESTSDTRIILRGTISSWLEMRQFLYDLRERIQG
jgi:TRAP-type uncharacterized transport system substrate-binding protein